MCLLVLFNLISLFSDGKIKINKPKLNYAQRQALDRQHILDFCSEKLELLTNAEAVDDIIEEIRSQGHALVCYSRYKVLENKSSEHHYWMEEEANTREKLSENNAWPRFS